MTEYYSPSLEEIYEVTLRIAEEVVRRGIKVDLIVGISRGGLIPARYFSDLLGVKNIEVIRAEYYTGVMERGERPKIKVPPDLKVEGLNVLLVDDVADTGDTIIEVEKELIRRGAKRVYVATLYTKPWNKARVDFYSVRVDSWIIFPWEIAETLVKVERGKWREVRESIKLREDLKDRLIKLVEDEEAKT